MIKVNGIEKQCHSCGNKDLEVINIEYDIGTYIVWCNDCKDTTLEDELITENFKEINFITKEEVLFYKDID